MRLYTIGFTKTTAENFFDRLKEAEVKKVLDIRLHNNSQLAGFAKKEDLAFFLKQIVPCDYEHRLDLAPTEKILKKYRGQNGSWNTYAKNFLKLIRDREIEKIFKKRQLEHSCLLCSEDKPHFCHRKLVAEYLHEKWGGIELVHL